MVVTIEVVMTEIDPWNARVGVTVFIVADRQVCSIPLFIIRVPNLPRCDSFIA